MSVARPTPAAVRWGISEIRHDDVSEKLLPSDCVLGFDRGSPMSGLGERGRAAFFVGETR